MCSREESHGVELPLRFNVKSEKECFEVWSLVTAEIWSLIQMLIQIIRNVDFHLACCKARLREEVSVCVCMCVMEEVNGYTGCVYVPGRQTDRQETDH